MTFSAKDVSAVQHFDGPAMFISKLNSKRPQPTGFRVIPLSTRCGLLRDIDHSDGKTPSGPCINRQLFTVREPRRRSVEVSAQFTADWSMEDGRVDVRVPVMLGIALLQMPCNLAGKV